MSTDYVAGNPYCIHADCAAHAVEELQHMAKLLPYREDVKRALGTMEKRLLSAALRDDGTVRCRHVPRKGPIQVPFA